MSNSKWFCGTYFFYLWFRRIQSQHKIAELFLRKVSRLCGGARSGKGAILKPHIQEVESRAHPKQSFDAVEASAAEKEQCALFKRILFISVPDDHGKAVDPLAQVHGSTRQDNAAH